MISVRPLLRASIASLLASGALAQPASDSQTTATIPTASPVHALALSDLANAFDGARCLAGVATQLSFGPRIPGTPGHRKQVEWMVTELQHAGFTVEISDGGSWTPALTRKQIAITNIVARWHTERPRRLFFSAHFDTRPICDGPNTPGDKFMSPVPGANDAGSGVAILIEAARAITAHPPANLGIFIVLHDSEDLGVTASMKSNDQYKEFAVGAQRLASKWKQSETFEAGVNLDMVGEKKEPRFKPEAYSREKLPALVSEFWSIGHEVSPELFVDEPTGYISDDQLPYLANNLPVIDVIDIDYEAWHTPFDDLDHVSLDTMQTIGKTVLEFVARRDHRARKTP